MTMKSLRVGRFLSSILLVLFSVHRSHGLQLAEQHALHVKENKSRNLQANYTLYTYDVTAMYGFNFNGTTPEPPNETHVDELLRMTEIFFKRNMASMFPRSYQNMQLVYESHEWKPTDKSSSTTTADADDKDETKLQVTFEVRTIFRDVEPIPDKDQVLDVIVQFRQDAYLSYFVRTVPPEAVFTRTISAAISAEIKSSGTYIQTSPPTASPVATEDIPQGNGQTPVLATAPPTPASTDVVAGYDQDTQEESAVVTDNQSEPDAQEDAESQEPGFPEADELVENKVADSQTGSEKSQKTNKTKQNENDKIKKKNLDVYYDQLTASNMFYWMTAACAFYCIGRIVLQKWSLAYHQSDKKRALESYWVQLALYTPVVGVLIWVTMLIHGDADHMPCVEKGLAIFSHVVMLLLAMLGMELYLRGQCMSWLLQIYRVMMIAVMLYVISPHHGIKKDPMDQMVFGVIEAFGIVTDHPTLVAMIYYRTWKDSTPQEKGFIRLRAVSVMRWALMISVALKVALISVSLWWYSVRWNHLTDTSLIWFVPLVRAIQTLVLIYLFHAQQSLYKAVAWGSSNHHPTGEKPDGTDAGSEDDQQEEDHV